MEIEKNIDPIKLFNEWFEQAKEKEIRDPNAMLLATVSKEGMPSLRTVLLKDIINNSFIFFTNYESKKAKDILETGKGAICFYWKSLNRQVRLVGNIKKISSEISDSYFSTRSRESKIGAWASKQSTPLDSRDTLIKKVQEFEVNFKTSIPRPNFWGGFALIPNEFEFWQDGDFRLHDRFVLKPVKNSILWESTRLYP